MTKCRSCGYNNLGGRTNCAQCGYLLTSIKVLMLFVLATMITACTTLPVKKDELKELIKDTKNSNIYFVNREIQPYVNRVITMSQTMNKPMVYSNLMVVFSDMKDQDDEDAFGYCAVIYGTPTIAINKKDWDTMGDSRREALILHEMVHCLKNRDHCNDTFEGMKVSIMHKDLIYEDDYIEMRNYYIAEAFYPHPSCTAKEIVWQGK